MTFPTKAAGKNINWLKWLLLLSITFIAGYTVIRMYAENEFVFALLVLVLSASGLVVFSRKDTYSHRYIYPGVAAVFLFIVFPLLYTIGIAFTNYSGSNQLTFERTQSQFLQEIFETPNSEYDFSIYLSSNDQLSLQFESEDQTFISPLISLSQANKNIKIVQGEVPEDSTKAPLKFIIQNKAKLKAFGITTPSNDALTMSSLRTFSQSAPLYELQEDQETLLNLVTGEEIKPNFDTGFYQPVDNLGNFIDSGISPGFVVNAGWQNFTKIFLDEGIQGPFVQIFIWTIVFSLLSVFFTVSLGLLLASLVQWEELRGRAIYRMLLILPYAVPAFISILIFKGLFNQSFGEINEFLDMIFGFKINWFTEPYMAKTMLVLVNTWLGYPYFMILCMGLLKSIPSDLYEVSAIDGATPIDNFFKITLPLMIKPLTPLLIASFAFNFNNFVLIQLLTNGTPDIIGSSTPAGHTDLLVSYTYRIAFEGGGGLDFGLASAIATLIFIIVGALALINLRLSKNQAG